jgi:hypothetical protein
MPNTLTTIPAPRVPLIDPATGLISNEWYRFLSFMQFYSKERGLVFTDLE